MIFAYNVAVIATVTNGARYRDALDIFPYFQSYRDCVDYEYRLGYLIRMASKAQAPMQNG